MTASDEHVGVIFNCQARPLVALGETYVGAKGRYAAEWRAQSQQFWKCDCALAAKELVVCTESKPHYRRMRASGIGRGGGGGYALRKYSEARGRDL